MRKVITILGLTILIIGGVILAKFKLSPKNDINKTKKMKEEDVRQPAVAGTFYPDNPTELKNKINNFLSSANDQMRNDQMVNILIVPHAGYDYSGSVAADGFKQIKSNYDTVILLGASHQTYFKGAVIDENTAWETPLGNVDINLTTAQKIVDSSPNFKFNSQAHAQEHSLEVQLPFLQTVLDDFKIVPILFGESTNEDINKLASTIHENLTPNTLLVISTDLSHYPSYDIANSVDERTISAILTGDPEKFEQKVNEQLSQNYPNLDTCACAEKAVKTGMIVAENIVEDNLRGSEGSSEVGDWQLIKYANSGDIIGEKSQVVGYAALTFSQRNSNLQSSNVQNGLKKNEKDKLLEIARETLETYINTGKKPNVEITEPRLRESNSPLQEKLGVFVTLRKNDQLRGCMGKFEPTTPLWQTVIDRTISAATKDPRFQPVKSEEIEDIEIEISVLSKPEPIDSWKNIELGKHGVIVEKGNRGGTYLPQVGTEQDWKNVEEFLSHLCANKAGLPIDCYKDSDTKLLTYTADVFSE